MHIVEFLKGINKKLDAGVSVSINNSNMTLYGADIADRPPADSVAIGTTFTLVNADLDTWISNGTDWVVI